MNFSIIIPVYNAEPFLIKCLNSIFNQNANCDFEVIAINDCSTDESLEILKKYSNFDKRLTILEHQENKGQAIARSTGMKIAKGDYIMHVDADDWLLEGAFVEIYKKIEKFNPDVLVLNSYTQIYNQEKVEVINFKKEGFYHDGHFNTDYVQSAFYQHSGTKVVRRKLVNELFVNTYGYKTTAEDFLYCFEVFLKSKSFYFLPKSYYVANVHVNSVTQTAKNYMKINNQIELLDTLLNLINKYKPDRKIILHVINFLQKTTSYNIFLSFLDGNFQKILKTQLVNSYKLFPYYELSNSLIEKSSKSIFNCCVEVVKQRGLVKIISFSIRYLFSKFKSKF